MVKSHELNIEGKKSRKRDGRGIAAGRGKTAGRGTKGQNSRSGGKRRPGFEGGQNPFSMRLPKNRGFKSFKEPKQTVYTSDLNSLKGKVDNFVLFENGIIGNPYGDAKLVVKGELTAKVDLQIAGASEGAKAAVEAAGGSFTQTESPNREKIEKKSEK